MEKENFVKAVSDLSLMFMTNHKKPLKLITKKVRKFRINVVRTM